MATDSGTQPKKNEEPQRDGTAFKREGPQPADRDTGGTIEEMNQEAERSIVRNIKPDERVD